jgi:peptidoglycan/xylan/chitin deacetylase (PgdA/CDA1 family)
MIEKLPLLAWPRQQGLTTLIFHRVLPEIDPMRPGEPGLIQFEQLMRFIALNFTVLPLRESVDRLVRGILPHRTCSITFDDGYADNFTLALPILEKYRLPATVFVATGYLDGGRMFNDAVIDALARSPRQLLDLSELELGSYSIATSEEKRNAIGAILGKLKYRPPEQRDVEVTRLIELCESGPLPSDIMLTSDQVGELSRRGIEIGGHTVAHTILTTLDDKWAQREIFEGKKQLEELTGKPVTVFAYPNGRPQQDYAAHHVSMVREAGFDVAVTTAYGVANPATDLLQLPRFTPWSRSPVRASFQLLRNAWHLCPVDVC